MPAIDIRQLHVRLRGVSADVAQDALAQFAGALRQELRSRQMGKAVHEASVDAGKARLSSPRPSSRQVAEAMAQQVAGSLAGLGDSPSKHT